MRLRRNNAYPPASVPQAAMLQPSCHASPARNPMLKPAARHPLAMSAQGALSGRNRPGAVANLGSVHEAAQRWIQPIALVQCASIIPDDEIALLPLLGPNMRAALDMRPKLIKQRVAFGIRKAHDPGIRSAAEVERHATRLRVADR